MIHLFSQTQVALKSAAVDVDTKAALAQAANEARGIAMDSIAAAHSGHMGLPLGCAEIGATLYGGQVRKFNKTRPMMAHTVDAFSFEDLHAYVLTRLCVHTIFARIQSHILSS